MEDRLHLSLPAFQLQPSSVLGSVSGSWSPTADTHFSGSEPSLADDRPSEPQQRTQLS